MPRYRKMMIVYSVLSLIFLASIVRENRLHRWYEAEAMVACFSVTLVSIVVCYIRKQ